jgi:sugar phosphate isomerase/epimerase
MPTLPLLLHSVSYSGSWGQAALSLDQFVDKAGSLEFGGVMLMAKRPHLSPLDFDAAPRRELRDRLSAAGLTHNVLAGYTNFTADLEHAEIPQREMQIHYVEALCQLGADVGAPMVRIFTGYEHPAAPFSTQWRMIADALRECARRAAAYGVTLVLQNHHDVAVGWESFRDLLVEVDEPNLRAGFDAWAPALHGDDLAVSAASLAPFMAHTTVADYVRRPRHRYEPTLVNYVPATPFVQAVPFGEGFIDYGAFFDAATKAGYTGGVAYEMCSPILGGGSEENLDRYARKFVAWMRGR